MVSESRTPIEAVIYEINTERSSFFESSLVMRSIGFASDFNHLIAASQGDSITILCHG